MSWKRTLIIMAFFCLAAFLAYIGSDKIETVLGSATTIIGFYFGVKGKGESVP